MEYKHQTFNRDVGTNIVLIFFLSDSVNIQYSSVTPEDVGLECNWNELNKFMWASICTRMNRTKIN